MKEQDRLVTDVLSFYKNYGSPIHEIIIDEYVNSISVVTNN
jgi:hypothetical protein